MRLPFGRQELIGPNDARFTEIMMALRLQAEKLSRTAARLSARGRSSSSSASGRSRRET